MIKALEITVKIGCPLDCGFCPQSKLKNAYSYTGEREMDYMGFANCMATVPRDVRIDWSGFAEPLIGKDVGQMMLDVHEFGYRQHLFTTLVGLNHEKMQAISASKMDNIRIHVPDQKFMLIPDDKWIDLHRIFGRSELPATYMAMGQLTPKVETFLRHLGIKVEMPDMLSRGGNLWKKRHLDGKIRCAAERWHQNVLLPNGDVMACCMDYGLSMPLGNLLRQPYSEIESKANEYEANNNPPDTSICRSCEWCAPL